MLLGKDILGFGRRDQAISPPLFGSRERLMEERGVGWIENKVGTNRFEGLAGRIFTRLKIWSNAIKYPLTRGPVLLFPEVFWQG
jgi:hypothetical protein